MLSVSVFHACIHAWHTMIGFLFLQCYQVYDVIQVNAFILEDVHECRAGKDELLDRLKVIT